MRLRLAILALAVAMCAAAPKTDYCADFTPGHRFSESILAGTIWTRSERPKDRSPSSTTEDLFAGATYSWFYELTDKERVAYAVEMRQHFPDVDWGRVRYSWNFDNPSRGGPDSFRFLIEVGPGEGGEGDVRAVPVDATYRHLRAVAPLRYRFRQLPSSLAVAYCAAPHTYTLQTPTPTVFST